MAETGKLNQLVVVRMSTNGLYLDGRELGEILLPRRYILPHVRPGDRLDVFVYRDSEDRLVATTETPLATVGEFACLRVITIHDQVGAFLDWGLSKDLLLPFREQVAPVRPGQHVVVYVYLDPKTERIVATSRLKRHLSRSLPTYRPGQAVELMVVAKTPLGCSALVEGAHLGMLYQNPNSAPLQPGQKVKGFVRQVWPSGKIDLSLDASGYKRVASLTELIVQALQSSGGRIEFDDDSPPDAIRQRFGVSKKAFKQALGALYKARRIQFQDHGTQLIENSSWAPGAQE